MYDFKDWTKLGEKTALLALTQAETALKETLETAKGISAKADRLLSITIPFLSALIIYSLNNVKKITEFLPLTAFFAIGITLISFIFLLQNFWHYRIRIPGEWPKNILRTEFIDNEYSKEQQYVSVILFICKSIQHRIDQNDLTNSKRTRNNKMALIFLMLLPLAPILSFVVRLFF